MLDLVKIEREKFKSNNIDYFNCPEKEIQRALNELSEKQWEKNWMDFIEAMVFESNPPTYKRALKSLCDISEKCLIEIEKEQWGTPQKQH